MTRHVKVLRESFSLLLVTCHPANNNVLPSCCHGNQRSSVPAIKYQSSHDWQLALLYSDRGEEPGCRRNLPRLFLLAHLLLWLHLFYKADGLNLAGGAFEAQSCDCQTQVFVAFGAPSWGLFKPWVESP